MCDNRTLTLVEFVENLALGEDVVVEYSSEEPAYLLFREILSELSRTGGFIIVDELDQLHIFRTHLRLSGRDTSCIDDSTVIKMGGIIQTGRVAGRVDLTKEPPVRKKHYEELIRSIEGRYKFRVVVGFDKILSSYENDPRERERIFGYLIRPHIGSENRITLYLINRDLVRDTVRKELREHATRVLESEFNGKGFTLRIVKSIVPEEYGCAVSVPIRGDE